MRKLFYLVILAVAVAACTDEKPNTTTSGMFFPSTTDTVWERVSPLTLGWKTDKLNELYSYLEQKHSKSFIILVNGRIVCEK